ncbi:MAG TPA: hypothetical protein VHU80_02980, partial [Polyangiaceae bacterium]|nr:hypothetical protein [Polyangiaceae bacterium]
MPRGEDDALDVAFLRRSLGPRALECLTFVLATVFVAAFLVLALHRLFYPFEVSWMESAMAEMTLRRVRGSPLYAEPSLVYTPCLYPPLFFDLSSVVERLFGL